MPVAAALLNTAPSPPPPHGSEGRGPPWFRRAPGSPCAAQGRRPTGMHVRGAACGLSGRVLSCLD